MIMKYRLVENKIFLYSILCLFSLGLGIFIVRFSPSELKSLLSFIGILFFLFFLISFLIKPELMINLFILFLPLLYPYDLIFELNLAEFILLFIIPIGILTIFISKAKSTEAYSKMKSVLIALIAFTVFNSLSSAANFTSGSALTQIIKGVFKPLYFVVASLLIFIHFDTEKKLNKLVLSIILGSLFVCFYGLFSYFMGWAYSEYLRFPRVHSTFFNINSLGGYLVLMLPFTVGYSSLLRKKIQKILIHIVILLQVINVCLCSTLGSILALAFAFIIFSSWQKNGFRLAIKWGILGTIILGFTHLFFSPFFERVTIASVLSRARGRVITYYTALRLAQYNLLFGIGSDNAWDLILETPSLQYTQWGISTSVPHNEFLSVLAENGIFSLLSLILILFFFFRTILRKWSFIKHSKNRNFYYGMISGCVGFVIQNLSNNLLLHPRIGIFFFIFLPLLLKMLELEQGTMRKSLKDYSYY